MRNCATEPLPDQDIDAAKIAVATGAQRELDGINLADPACPIEYVITVQALKEGWDCSFAYVFCPWRISGMPPTPNNCRAVCCACPMLPAASPLR